MQPYDKIALLQEKEYGDFQSKLIPTIPRETIIGVRVPLLRQIAKEYQKEIRKEKGNTTQKTYREIKQFMEQLPHKYYEENIFHGILISEEKDYGKCIRQLEQFLPYVDNWAVCDTISPKIFKSHTQELILEIRKWCASPHAYTCRFGIEMLMKFYLEDAFLEEYLEIPAQIRSQEYYVNMMIAWFFATGLAKQWDSTIPYIKEKRLEKWVHGKTIQKARESNRITKEQKAYLRKFL